MAAGSPGKAWRHPKGHCICRTSLGSFETKWASILVLAPPEGFLKKSQLTGIVSSYSQRESEGSSHFMRLSTPHKAVDAISSEPSHI